MKNKISCKLLGPGELISGCHNYGLCNQMFQIASIISYAYDNNMIATFPVLQDKNKYGNYIDNIFRKLEINSNIDENHCHYTQPNFKYNPIPQFNSSCMIQNSYLQSEKYFIHNRQLILNTFEPRKCDIEYINSKYKNTFNNNKTISCHIRRGDYVQLAQAHSSLWETDYYQKALNIAGKGLLLMFSDDKLWVKEKFKHIENILFIDEEDYLELYIMSMCDCNIIANSTFSWWGAWLNTKSNKKIIAPISWFPSSNTDVDDKDLIPKEWLRL